MAVILNIIFSIRIQFYAFLAPRVKLTTCRSVVIDRSWDGKPVHDCCVSLCSDWICSCTLTIRVFPTRLRSDEASQHALRYRRGGRAVLEECSEGYALHRDSSFNLLESLGRVFRDLLTAATVLPRHTTQKPSPRLVEPFDRKSSEKHTAQDTLPAPTA